MRLIDADALELVPGIRDKQNCRIVGGRSNGKTLLTLAAFFQKKIDNAPTVEATPVVHGRWIHTTKDDDDWGGTFHRFTCSACNWSMGDNPDGWGNYCPNCGTKMYEE